MAHTLANFEKQLASGELKPAYLIAGEEHLLVLEAADALRARARALGYNERDVLDVEAHFDWDALARAGASMSLFASRRLIDLRMPTGKPGKEGSDSIVEYCENPPPDTVLLVICNQWSKQQQGGAWVSAIERVGMVVPVWPLKADELPDWIGRRMASRGLKPDRGAIEALAERVEGNSLAAAQEIDKLALLHGGKLLDAATLEELVTDSSRYDVFKLVEAALEGDASRTIRVLQGLRAEGEAVPALMGWVLNQLQLIARLAAHANLAAAFRNEHIYPARERVYRQALQRADRTHWEKCLLQAARVDRLSKGRGWGDPWRELERLMAAVAMPRAKLLASA